MSIIIKLRGLPLEANSVDVRLYFLGLNIPDGGVHIVGGEDGIVFIEFANDEDARQAMARSLGTIKNSTVNLLLSSRAEMLSLIDSIRQKHQLYLQQNQNQHPQTQTQPLPLPQHQTLIQHQPQQQQQHLHQQMLLQPQLQNQPPIDPSAHVPQPWYNTQQVPLLPAWMHPQTPVTTTATQLQTSLLNPPNTVPPNMLAGQLDQQLLLQQQQQALQQQQQQQHQHQQQQQQQHHQQEPQQPKDSRARAKGMRGGDDRLFANKKCVLAASNIPYRATSKDIIDFLADFNITEDNIRRRYNQKNQPTADAKIAFQTPDMAMKALKLMNKKTLCGRPVFLKPV